MEMKKDFEQDVSQLQVLEQNLQNLGMQKQNMQLQVMEIEGSLKELDTYEGSAYKIIGPVMIEADRENLVKDLNEKKEVLNTRLKSVEEQESSLKKNFESIQKKLMKNLGK
tara:strand:+ start:6905 stop:7237 length:333 start_codon:yes stop_codon:yes gene_type:complete